MQLVLASNNLKKLSELRAMLDGVRVDLISQRDLGIGDAGAVRELLAWAADVGLGFVQFLPINVMLLPNMKGISLLVAPHYMYPGLCLHII